VETLSGICVGASRDRGFPGLDYSSSAGGRRVVDHATVLDLRLPSQKLPTGFGT
jgi:hypothetical protein